MANSTLRTAKLNKQDEFYTQRGDIENELKHYKEQLHGKVIFCNCDDPYESNFFKYFAGNFNALKLKKLIATSYIKSPIVGGQLPLINIEGLKPEGKEPYKIEINEVPDINRDGAISLDDVEYLLKHEKNAATPLKGDAKYNAGDFRSDECVELLKEADIVVTNPPFSLFREYVSQLMEHGKKFLIIGSKNAITYQDVFRFIEKNEIWLGHGFANGNAYFSISPKMAREFAAGVYDAKTGLVKFRNVGWFTNLDYKERHETLPLYKPYTPEGYPRYDNYDAINIDKVSEIPVDYNGIMGVPITFLDNYNPEQFNIIGMSKTPIGTHLRTKTFSKQTQVDKNGERSIVTKLNDGAAIKVVAPPADKTYYIVNGEYYIAIYPRILIKRKNLI